MVETLREHALASFRAGLAAADPSSKLEHVELQEPGPGGRLIVLGAGKAAAALARAVEARLGDAPFSGRVIVKHGHGLSLQHLSVDEAGHPLPDASGVAATTRLLADVGTASEADQVLFLLTGGASAVLVAPADGLSLDDKIAVTDLLLRCGATIQEINTVRKHLSAVKGGRLLERLAPAHVQTLVVSDVIGDDLSSIGSGPTTADPTTFADALGVFERYDLDSELPGAVLEHLRLGAAGKISETPKPGDPLLERVEHHILASNRDSVDAAAAAAGALGFHAEIFAYDMVGEVHDQARAFTKALTARAADPSKPVALIGGGELTLEVRGSGKGGRAQELALVAAREIAGVDDVLVLAAGTDGTDGPTDAAGAMATGDTWAAASSSGLDPAAMLDNNDAYHVFDRLEALIKTGPTGTNVNDLVIGLRGLPGSRAPSSTR